MYKPQQSLDVWNTRNGKAIRLAYTSLYSVAKLEKAKNAFILPEQNSHGLKYNSINITEQYIWGAELIHAIVEQG
jgi:hypothetical protein